MYLSFGKFPMAVSQEYVLFYDQCAIYHSTQIHNVVFWTKENPHFAIKLENNPPNMMLRGGLSASHHLGLHFFERPINIVMLAIIRTEKSNGCGSSKMVHQPILHCMNFSGISWLVDWSGICNHLHAWLRQDLTFTWQQALGNHKMLHLGTSLMTGYRPL